MCSTFMLTGMCAGNTKNVKLWYYVCVSKTGMVVDNMYVHVSLGIKLLLLNLITT